MNQLFLASDHGGFELKQALKIWLEAEHYPVVDLGPFVLDEDDDYPVFASAVAKEVSQDPQNRGILLCRSGQGMTIVANKFVSVRAALAWNKESAAAAVGDDAANVLCLPTDYISEDEAKRIISTFLENTPKFESRYQRRLNEIRLIEEQNFKP